MIRLLISCISHKAWVYMTMLIAPFFQTRVNGQRRIRDAKNLLNATSDESIDSVIATVADDDIRLSVNTLANRWNGLDLRTDAAIVLTNVLSGDTLNTVHKIHAIDGVVSTLFQHADASMNPLKIAENCTIALGNMAADCDELRVLLCTHGIFDVIFRSVEHMVAAADLRHESAIEHALWVLSGVCECAHNHCIDYKSVIETTCIVMQRHNSSVKLKKRIARILSLCVSAPGTIELGMVELLTQKKVHQMLINNYLASRISQSTMLDTLKVLNCISSEANPKYTALLVDGRIFQVMDSVFDGGVHSIGSECMVQLLCLLSNILADMDNACFFFGTSLPHRLCTLYGTIATDSIRNECAFCCANAIYNDTIQDLDSIYSSRMLSVLVDTIKRDAPCELKTLCLDAIDRMASKD